MKELLENGSVFIFGEDVLSFVKECEENNVPVHAGEITEDGQYFFIDK